MLDGLETVEIACGERFAGRERDSMLDGKETVEVAYRERATQDAGRRGNRGNSLRKVSPGRSDAWK